MNAKSHILWGGIVGGFVAIAFNISLWVQFSIESRVEFLIVSLPTCAILGAIFGWAWWRVLGKY